MHAGMLEEEGDLINMDDVDMDDDDDDDDQMAELHEEALRRMVAGGAG